MTHKTQKILWICVISIVVMAIAFTVVRYFIARRPFVYSGTLETTKVILSARVSSDISEFMVEEGDMVKRDQPLVGLSCDSYKILAAQIDADFSRSEQLLSAGHLPQAQYDVILRNKRDNDLKLMWCRITSPIDGMVITKFREIGEIVAPGNAIISLANPYDIWAYFYVPYEMLHKLHVGQSVIGILPEAENMKFSGRIIKISEEAEFTPKNVQTREERTRLVYGIKVQFDNPDLILKSGMTIESTLINE